MSGSSPSAFRAVSTTMTTAEPGMYGGGNGSGVQRLLFSPNPSPSNFGLPSPARNRITSPSRFKAPDTIDSDSDDDDELRIDERGTFLTPAYTFNFDSPTLKIESAPALPVEVQLPIPKDSAPSTSSTASPAGSASPSSSPYISSSPYRLQHDDTDTVLADIKKLRQKEVEAAMARKANEISDALAQLRLKTESDLKEKEAQHVAEGERRRDEMAQQRRKQQQAIAEQRQKLHAQMLHEEKLLKQQFDMYVAEEQAKARAIEEQRRKEEAAKQAKEDAERKRRAEEEAKKKAIAEAEAKRKADEQKAQAAAAAAQQQQRQQQQQQQQQQQAAPQQPALSSPADAAGGSLRSAQAIAPATGTNTAAAPATPGGWVAAGPWAEYQRIHDLMQRSEALFAADFPKKNEIFKNINLPAFQITSKRAVIEQKCNRLAEVLAGALLQAPEMVKVYVLYTTAERLIGQVDRTISRTPQFAFAVARVLMPLVIKWPVLMDYMLGHLYKNCPYAVPMYPPKPASMSGEDYLFNVLKFKKTAEGAPEAEDQYRERMAGYIYLLAAFIAIDPPAKQNHPFDIAKCWTWMANLLNMKPRKVTPHILLAFLEVRYCPCLQLTERGNYGDKPLIFIPLANHAGYRLWKTYGKQFEKILQFIKNDYLNRMPPECAASRMRLELYIESIEKDRALKIPKGFTPDE